MTKAERISEILEVNTNWTESELTAMSAAEVTSIHERVMSTEKEVAEPSQKTTPLDEMKLRMSQLKDDDAIGMINLARDLQKYAKSKV